MTTQRNRPSPCDGTFQLYSFTIVPTHDYADKRFRPGRAIVEYVITQCTDPTISPVQCTQDELVREPVRITPYRPAGRRSSVLTSGFSVPTATTMAHC